MKVNETPEVPFWIRFGLSIIDALMKGPWVRPHRRNAWKKDLLQIGLTSNSPKPNRVFAFHASSVGELEMLMPWIDRAIELGSSVVVTAFSDSALPWLEKIKAQDSRGAVLYCGLSPLESKWEAFYLSWGVQKVWLARYDAWPGWWIAVSRLKLSVVIVNAEWSPSWAWVRRLVRLGFSPLQVWWMNARAAALVVLRQEWAQAKLPSGSQFDFVESVDPRRVRLALRLGAISDSLRTRLDRWKPQATPGQILGIIGSAWVGDLRQLRKWALELPQPWSQVLVFPHSFESEVLVQLQFEVEQMRASGMAVELVLEKGILVEAYAIADWVWVGGGYDHGIHSVLEPSVHAVPILGGPKNAERFADVQDAMDRGQFRFAAGSNDLKWAWSQPQIRPLSLPQVAEFFAVADPHLQPSGLSVTINQGSISK